MSAPGHFPLAWPPERPRTPAWKRQYGRFKADGRPVTMAVAVDRLDAELGRLGAAYPMLSSNVKLRLDGRPRSGEPRPTDPGACVYFLLKGKPFALACDSYESVEQNVAALAAHLEATRAIERHGVATAAETLEAFSALPPPSAGARPPRTWREILGFDAAFPAGFSADEAETLISGRFRERAKAAHPDHGGSTAAMTELTAARDAALQEVKS